MSEENVFQISASVKAYVPDPTKITTIEDVVEVLCGIGLQYLHWSNHGPLPSAIVKYFKEAEDGEEA